jgi:hypothetical protein
MRLVASAHLQHKDAKNVIGTLFQGTNGFSAGHRRDAEPRSNAAACCGSSEPAGHPAERKSETNEYRLPHARGASAETRKSAATTI